MQELVGLVEDKAKRRPFIIAITGGIASGKTCVSDLFAKSGVPVIDTDLIARDLTQPGTPCFKEIVRKFGEGILLPSGHLNRSALREIVFSDETARKVLESVLHPAIWESAARAIGHVSEPYCVVVIPLLAETGKPIWVDRILVVDVGLDTQLARLVARDRMSPEQAMRIIAAQSSRDERLRIADDVVRNEGSKALLRRAISELHEKYQTLAREHQIP